MSPLPHRAMLAVGAIVDVALHARGQPVASRQLADRLGLPPRHLETLLQLLVREGLLKGMRGPRGGYELARERRRISVADIVRAVWSEADADDDRVVVPLIENVVAPRLEGANRAFLAGLEAISVEELCRDARRFEAMPEQDADFTI